MMNLSFAPDHPVSGTYTQAEYLALLIVTGVGDLTVPKSRDCICSVAAPVLSREDVTRALNLLVRHKYLLTPDGDSYIRAPHVYCREIIRGDQSVCPIMIMCKDGRYAYMLPAQSTKATYDLARVVLDAELEQRVGELPPFSRITLMQGDEKRQVNITISDLPMDLTSRNPREVN